MSYVRFMSLVMDAASIVTDSGGIQEETTYLGIPCFTLRENTERPITIAQGTNRLATAASLWMRPIRWFTASGRSPSNAWSSRPVNAGRSVGSGRGVGEEAKLENSVEI